MQTEWMCFNHTDLSETIRGITKLLNPKYFGVTDLHILEYWIDKNAKNVLKPG